MSLISDMINVGIINPNQTENKQNEHHHISVNYAVDAAIET